MLYRGAVVELPKGVAEVEPLKRGVINGIKFDGLKEEAYLDLLRNGRGRCKAAREVGITIKTIERHMVRNPNFKALVSLAEMEANQKIENALFEAAMTGNVTAIQVW